MSYSVKPKDKKKFSIKETWHNACTVWRGLVIAGRFLFDFYIGASMVAVIYMAVRFAMQFTYNRPLFYAMTVAIVTMALIALRVLGKYAIEKGKVRED
jgi:hypothetical protein